MQNSIELLRLLHHGRMSTFVNKMQLAVRDQLAKLLTNKRRSDRIIIPPDKQGGLFYLADLFAQVVPDRTLGQCNDLDSLDAYIDGLIELVYQLLGGKGRIIKG